MKIYDWESYDFDKKRKLKKAGMQYFLVMTLAKDRLLRHSILMEMNFLNQSKSTVFPVIFS